MCACARFVPGCTGMCACRPENSLWQCSSGVVNLTPCHWLQSRLPGQRDPGVLGPLPPQTWAYKRIPCARHFFFLNMDSGDWIQNVISISSAHFVSPRGCTDGEVLSSSLFKKKKKSRNAETENNSRALMAQASPFLLVSGIFLEYFASNNQGKCCPQALTRLQQGQCSGRAQDFHLKTGRSY